MNSKSIRCAALAAALGLAMVATADGTLNGVSVDKSGPGVAVHIKGKDLAQPTKSWAKQGSLVLEFDATLSGKPALTPVNDDGVKSVLVQRRRTQNKVRVVLSLDKNSEPELSRTDEGWVVKFGGPEAVVRKTEPGLPPLENAEKLIAQARGVTDSKASRGPAATFAGDNVRVSLEFVNTQVVQILKALAMQAGVNIVTAPEVKGSLTVSLDNVTVKEALDMVTTVSNLRYSRVGGTYLVTTPEKFKSAMDTLSGRKAFMLDTRVIPIYSGQGPEIRASVLTAMAEDASFGNFQMFLPGENYKLEKKSSNTPEGESTSTDVSVEKGAPAAPKTDDPTKGASHNGMKEQYLVLVGPRDTADEVERRIRELDGEIAKAHGFDLSKDVSLVRRAYLLKSDDVKANDLVKAVGSTQPNSFLNVDLYATPPTFQTQSVVIVGREAEVDKAEAILRDLDSSGYGSEVMLYDVQHSDPRALREALIAQVKGLRVSVAPATAAGTRVFEEGKAVQQANQTNESAQGNSNPQDAKTKDVNDETFGLTAPFQNYEKIAVPMRLTLTGTEEQLDAARGYLAQIDIPAKQVAIELRVMELSKDDALRVGIDWDIFRSGSGVNLVSFAGSAFSPAAAGAIGATINGKNWGGDVTAVLDQIANSNNLIARPNILAVDGRESEIFVGDVIRYVESIQASQNGVTVTTGKVPVGVRLSVLPRVGGEFLTLDLRPAVSSLTGWLPVGDMGGQLPQTSLRTAQSTVSIRSGETIAIGGLIQDQDRKSVTKIPLLGDLPIIGRLFRKESTSKDRKEIVMFLTAKYVDNENRATAAHPRSNENREMPKP